MDIDLRKEELITLAEAAKLLPRRRLGKKCSVSCLHRWATRGLRGERLRVVQVGGVRCTSIEELDRFFAALSKPTSRHEEVASSSQRDHRDEGVKKELDRLGL